MTDISSMTQQAAALRAKNQATQAPRLGRLPVSGRPVQKINLPTGRQIVICGKPKMGKSTSVADARLPLYLDFEHRLEWLDVPRASPVYAPDGVDLDKNIYPFNVLLKDVEVGKKFQFLLDWLKETGADLRADGGNTFKTVTFDTIDTLIQLAREAFAADAKRTKNYQADYLDIYSRLMPMLKAFTTLPVDVIWQCHVEEIGAGAEQRVWLSTPPVVREWLTSHADMILYLYSPDKDGLNRFYCQTKDGWPSGDGTGLLPVDLPATMSAVYACFAGGDPELNQPQVERWKTGSIPVAQPPKAKRPRKEEKSEAAA